MVVLMATLLLASGSHQSRAAGHIDKTYKGNQMAMDKGLEEELCVCVCVYILTI